MADAIYGLILTMVFMIFLKMKGKREVKKLKWEYAGQKVSAIYNCVCTVK
jgi:hypothetical protein